MKFLVPTDFSDLSKNAARYAVEMAKQLNAEIILLNVLYIEGGPQASMLNPKKIEEVMFENATKDCQTLLGALKEGNGDLNISYKLIKNYPLTEVIERFATDNNIDLIITGTKGASGLAKILMGSNAAALIGKSALPVITVPAFANYKSIKNIVYATDMAALHKEVQSLITLVKMFNATLHVLHVEPLGKVFDFDTGKIENELISANAYTNIKVHLITANHLDEAIEACIESTNGDLLVMFTHTPSFSDKLFSRSATREMAFHSKVPLLSVKGVETLPSTRLFATNLPSE